MTTEPRAAARPPIPSLPALLGLALLAGLWGCKDDPPAAEADSAAPDAAPVDAAMPDAGPLDAAPPDASMDAQVFTGSMTIIKLGPAPTPGGGAKPTPTPTPTPGATPAPGRVSIMGTINKHQSEVIDCYAKVAESKPDIAGQLTMRWTLGADGKPTMAAVARNTLGDAGVGQCVKARSLKWQFPRPSGGTSVIKYTWNLRLQ